MQRRRCFRCSDPGTDPGLLTLLADQHFCQVVTAFAFGSAIAHQVLTIRDCCTRRGTVGSGICTTAPSDCMSWCAALHRSAAPHPPEFARLGAQGSASAKPTKHELFALVVSGLDETGADAGWKRTFLTEAAAVAASDSTVVKSSAASDGKVTVTHTCTRARQSYLQMLCSCLSPDCKVVQRSSAHMHAPVATRSVMEQHRPPLKRGAQGLHLSRRGIQPADLTGLPCGRCGCWWQAS